MEGEHEKIAKVVEEQVRHHTHEGDRIVLWGILPGERSVEEALQKLADISQNMGVLALGATNRGQDAWGEDGRKFVTAAEEVRVNAEQYTSAVADVLARISGFEETATEAEKQIHALNDLLKRK